MAAIKQYYHLTKPGMVRGNVFVAIAAFVFGSWGVFEWWTFIYMTVGLTLVVASACVFNNYADREMDAKMERTKNRALVVGDISPQGALAFGAILLTLGTYTLSHISIYALGAALLGFFVYVFVYTPMKPLSPYALYAGAVAGATPPLVGYTAAAHMLDYYALALFGFLFLWQIPHFLAIARFRYDEYAAAGVPTFVKRPESEEERKHAKKIFFYSLVVLLGACLILMLQRWMR